ncbi:MAG: class II D-tagatose-bisphosphate aldolase, non-catalytic subunit [Firmicutes bacterium]|nr:class II D-tagatose-bisphosphate aldolase, non-catalytic subunit [Bacillota bacterium]NLL87401.1 class II D-tagatose-bisphosphate aldolase, non-catalytic subunit [Bacillota bacterium]HKM17679.1 class II D-tagatose-bisphosphate aldolase, non-catalytic subunit [Limnochordia bacterium]
MLFVNPLKRLVGNYKQGRKIGMYSACTANELVIEACLERAKQAQSYVLIEATANQVNQYGGYSGMTPSGFRDYVHTIAARVGFPQKYIILGGDHLGPLTFSHLPAAEAMEEAKELIRQFAAAGFAKIHIDTSMRLGDDDPNQKLATELIAQRGAVLAQTAEEAFARLKAEYDAAVAPVYVIGSEVPVPGGSQEQEDTVQVTTAADFAETVDAYHDAFAEAGLHDAWQRVIAVVVQPGVEFADETIHPYNREAAAELCRALDAYPNLVFEGHSTDYQTPLHLRQMVEDGIVFLKVGPALTFGLREGLFALSMIESELLGPTSRPLANFPSALEAEMLASPKDWQKHYHGDEHQLRLARKYSLSDRSRYYLPREPVKKAVELLFANLEAGIPLGMLSQFMPMQYQKARSGELATSPRELVKDRVVNCIDEYLSATGILSWAKEG